MEEIIQKVAPEILPILVSRYGIMQKLLFAQPLGRRTLAASLEMGERVVRRELSLLASQGLVEIYEYFLA